MLETIFHQERHSGRMVLLKSASWRCRKRGGGKKADAEFMPEKIGKIRDPHRLEGILCLFFPLVAIAISCDRNCIHLSTLLQVFPMFQRDFSTSRV